MKIVISRTSINDKSITGELYVDGELICYTLEKPYLENKKEISSIPPGNYGAILRYDHNDQWRIELTGTDKRSHIQIHLGNVPEDSKGCILVGAKAFPKENRLEKSKEAYQNLKKAFYGTDNPKSTPNNEITISIGGKEIKNEKDFDIEKYLESETTSSSKFSF